eukprot:354442-Rhodomonas_salina.1
MKVAFTSDDNSDSMFKGFSAQYEAFGGRATNCPSADDPDVLAIGLTEQGIVDFWNDDAYLNNAQCRWILNLQGGAGVLELNFPRFQTESLYDTVRISECADAACTVVDTFGGEVVSGTVDPTMNYTTASAYVRPSPSLRDSSRFMHDWSFCPYRAAAMLELTTQGRAWLDSANTGRGFLANFRRCLACDVRNLCPEDLLLETTADGLDLVDFNYGLEGYGPTLAWPSLKRCFRESIKDFGVEMSAGTGIKREQG